MMGGETQNMGGLSQTMAEQAKLPLYGTSQEQLQELKDAQQKALEALESRYAQPNWFKVAAGFAKPQLGGFLASMGSAAEALGENVEQQRAQQLPIAQMRAQLAQTNLLLGKNKGVTEKIEKWKADHPGQMPSSAQIMEWRAEAPQSPTVQALAEQQKLGMEQQGQEIQRLQGLFSSGTITKKEYGERLKALQSTASYPYAPQNGKPSVPSEPTGTMPGVTPVSGAWHQGTTYAESRNKPDAKNPESTASGLYQVLDSTAQNPGYGIEPAKDASLAEKDRVGKEYLDKMTEKFGPAWGALAHHYGEGKVNEWLKAGDLSKLPPEAKAYLGEITLAQFKPGAEQKPVSQIDFESAGLTGEKASEQSATAVKGLEQNNIDYINYINSQRKNVTNERRNDLSRGLSIVDDPKVQEGMGQLYKNEGFVSGLQTALQEGLNFALNHTGGAFTAQVAFPVDKVITAASTDPQTKQKLRELMRIVIKDSLEDIKAGTSALGGGHMNAVEFQNVMGMFPTTSEPYKLMRQYLATRAARNELVSDLHSNWSKYSGTPDYAKKPLSNFFSLPEVEEAYNKHDARHRSALKLAD
jgi:hypothetical protein